MTADKQHAHALLDLVPPDNMTAAVRFLEFLLLDPPPRFSARTRDLELIEDEEITEAEVQAVARSKKWFKHNEGIPFEQVAADLGISMEQIRTHRMDDERDPTA